ncbi:ribosomal RNA small subunit methyltransferase H [Impatiens glandulifera]|uniref:ribosomal RNA small subunit methyltransferase H n=1 Tax=Impatiens glandulifera TaxID=253017 RepID=UPI001FB0A4FE|nr:ribosomal RNA small subunit methyltransferase H [Impatiens glandulifera]
MAVAALAADAARKLFLQTPLSFSSVRPRNFPHFRSFASLRPRRPNVFSPTVAAAAGGSSKSTAKKKSKSIPEKVDSESLKRRTRSVKEFDEEAALRFGGTTSHIPVMLGEVLEVFTSIPLRSFVDCTLGGAGHSCSMIQAHPEMQVYVGIDVDPVAHEKGQAMINSLLHDDLGGPISNLKAYTFVKNFSNIHHVINEIDNNLLIKGVDGIMMDLGMSSMQVNNAERGFSVLNDGPLDMRMNPKASLTAEDILNTWPEVELGRILRDYGEESNWYTLQNKIVKARLTGGLHSTRQLVNLIQNTSSRTRGGRQGWIKTATRVFQALRIAVNDELNTLESSLKSCFNCLGHGGRLAVISFHSLEDRIVKKTFLNIIESSSINKDDDEEERCLDSREIDGNNKEEEEGWIKQRVRGINGEILTKRPITPTEEEEKLNRRSRSAKLRVIQKF